MLTRDQLKEHAISFMKEEYDISADVPNGATIPNKELAIFESTSHCMLGIVFRNIFCKNQNLKIKFEVYFKKHTNDNFLPLPSRFW